MAKMTKTNEMEHSSRSVGWFVASTEAWLVSGCKVLSQTNKWPSTRNFDVVVPKDSVIMERSADIDATPRIVTSTIADHRRIG